MNHDTNNQRPRRLRRLLLGAAFVAVFVFGCDLPGIVDPIDGSALEPDVSLPDSCPAAPSCGDGNVIELCGESGTLEFVSCGRAETCVDGRCEDLTASCDGSRRPFRISNRELVFDVPELLTECDCTGPTGCRCESVDYKSQVRQLTIENCSDRSLYIFDLALKDSAVRPDGEPVFALDRSYRELEIRSGRSQTIDVFYRPAPGVSQLSESNLELSLLGDASDSYAVGLRTRSLCVTATPFEDIWTLIPGQSITTSALVQNCGTERVTLTGAEVVAWKGPGEPTLRIAEKLPFTLLAGGTATAKVTVTPEEPGLFEGTVRFNFVEERLRQGAETRIYGAAAEQGCSDAPLPPVELTANGVSVDPGHKFEPARFVGLRSEPRTTLRPYFTLESAPEGFKGRVFINDDGSGLLVPLVVGAYVVRYGALDVETGQLLCEFEDIPLTVLPSAPLYVELTWDTLDDPIPGDAGYGRGIDLDLYVLTGGQSSGWTSSEAACFPEASTPCSLAGGYRRVRSFAGGLPEAYAFDSSDQTFTFGAYLRNPYNFEEGARAQIRIWRDGELIEGASLSTPPDATAPARLRRANSFWVASQLFEGEGVPLDFHLNGIPGFAP